MPPLATIPRTRIPPREQILTLQSRVRPEDLSPGVGIGREPGAEKKRSESRTCEPQAASPFPGRGSHQSSRFSAIRKPSPACRRWLSSWKMHWKVEANRRWSWFRSIGSDPRSPVVGRDTERGARAGEVSAEPDVGALAPHRLRRQVGQNQTRVPAAREPDTLRSQDREREVPVAPDELVGLGVAAGERRLDQRPGQVADLSGRVGVLLVELERLPDQASRAPRRPGRPLKR